LIVARGKKNMAAAMKADYPKKKMIDNNEGCSETLKGWWKH